MAQLEIHYMINCLSYTVYASILISIMVTTPLLQGGKSDGGDPNIKFYFRKKQEKP